MFYTVYNAAEVMVSLHEYVQNQAINFVILVRNGFEANRLDSLTVHQINIYSITHDHRNQALKRCLDSRSVLDIRKCPKSFDS